MFQENKLESKFTPNFTNNQSIKAEEGMREVLDRSKEIGVEAEPISITAEQVLSLAQDKIPNRYNLVYNKLKEKGINIQDLPVDVLLDKLLAIDNVFRFNGKNYAVDVTTGKHTVVKSKEKKFRELKDVLMNIGFDHALIIRLKQDVTDDVILDLFTNLEQYNGNDFYMTFKYPETKK